MTREEIIKQCEKEGKKLPNRIWAEGMMEELRFGHEISDWYEDFDQYFDMLANGPLKGERDEYIEIVALKLTILNDGNDVSAVEFTIDEDNIEEPRWINIKIRWR